MATTFWFSMGYGYGGGFEWSADRMQMLPIPCN